MQPKIAQQLNQLLQTASIEEWLSTGKTIQLMKNNKAGATPSFYRPIICLCKTFKLMTAIIADTIQNHMCKYNLITLYNLRTERKLKKLLGHERQVTHQQDDTEELQTM